MGTPPHHVRDSRAAAPGAPATPSSPPLDEEAAGLARLCARLGLAMINSGESVAGTHAALARVASAYGVDDCSFYALPTGAIAVLRASSS